MIIPIGHDDLATNRWPYATYCIVLLCVLLHVFSNNIEKTSRPIELAEVAAFWSAHRYLDAPRVVRDAADSLPADAKHDGQHLNLSQQASLGAEALRQNQAQLNLMTDIALGRVELDTQRTKSLYEEYGLTPSSPRPFAFISYILVHTGWFHLLGNLVLLVLFASAIEDRWGRPLFLFLFLCSGMGAGAFHMAVTPDSPIPLVGASGAIAGMLGAFVVLFSRSNIDFRYFFITGKHGIHEAPALLMLPVWFGIEVMRASISEIFGVSNGVGYSAHIGGFLCGSALAFTVVKSGIEERFGYSAVVARRKRYSEMGVAKLALDLRDCELAADAMDLLKTELTRSPNSRELQRAIWEVAYSEDRSEEAVYDISRLIRREALEGNNETARDFWIELVDRVPDALVDPSTLMRILRALKGDTKRARRLQAFRQVLDPRNRSGLTFEIADQVADEAPSVDQELADRAAKIASELSDPSSPGFAFPEERESSV